MKRYVTVCPRCGGWIETNESGDTGMCDTCDVYMVNGEIVIPNENEEDETDNGTDNKEH